MSDKLPISILKKELVLTLVQKIGRILYETEIKQGSRELEIRAYWDGHLELMIDIEVDDLEILEGFFRSIRIEVSKLNEVKEMGLQDQDAPASQIV